MIIVQDPKTLKIEYYPSLVHACKYQKEWKYYSIRKKHLSTSPTKYKNMLWFRLKYH